MNKKAIELIDELEKKLKFIPDYEEHEHDILAIIKPLKSLIQEKQYNRKDLQKACSVAYQRGVDNRPYIEKVDEWINKEEEENG